MLSVKIGPIPSNGLLNKYADRPGCHTDCFYVDVYEAIELPDYILAFFETPVFRLERKMLGIIAASPSTKNEVADLASGSGVALAIWKVEARDDTQLIMAVGKGPVRTWLMSLPIQGRSDATRLYFGSAVLPTEVNRTGEPIMGKMFSVFLGFHNLYSRILLWSAKRQIKNCNG